MNVIYALSTAHPLPQLSETQHQYISSSAEHSSTENRQQIYVHLAYRILRQFVRLFMGRMSFDVMQQLLSRALVEEGRLLVQQSQEGKLVLSRVALLTGVKTQTVKDLAGSPPLYYPEGLTVEAIILHRWANDPRYQNNAEAGPARLLIHGTGLTFQRLVAVVAGRGVTTQAVLERLLARGNVAIVNSHWIELRDAHWQADSPSESAAVVQRAERWLAWADEINASS